jgi:hypothetical protein
MPEICRFYGVIIAMYYGDHGPAHFHAEYGEHEASIAVADGRLLRGSLPARAARFVRTWAVAHRAELKREWRLARAGAPLFKIAPLE